MNRNTRSQLARVIVMVALASAALSGAPKKNQVHPAPTAGGNPTVTIAVLADHYTIGEEQEFNHDVENFFKFGLLVDGYFKNKAADLKIVTFFEQTPAGQESIYDFKIEPGVGNCAVRDAGDAVGKINTALGDTHPVHTVVLGNYPYSFGCTDGPWTYVAVDAIGTDVLPHEFGHILAKLFDEWSLADNKTVDYPEVIQMTDTRNCWPTRPPATMPPHWRNDPQFGNAKELPECDLFGQKVVHPYEYCRMGVKHMHPPAFCPVCTAEMDATFDYYRDWRRFVTVIRSDSTSPANPQASHAPANAQGFRIMNAAFAQQPAPAPPPTQAPIPILRLVVEIDPERGTMTEKGRTNANGMYVPSYRRNGQLAYEFLENGKTVEVGVIPDDSFKARGYRGGAVHATSAKQPAEVVIAIPNQDTKRIQDPSRRFALVLYRIPDTVPGRLITVANFPAFRKGATRLTELPLTGPSPARQQK